MLSEKKIREHLRDRNLRVIAKRTGLSYGRLCYWIREGKQPHFSLVHTVGQYLEDNAKCILDEA
jgi:chemotaxis receptor (MCP) glutamine deamidase CheD